jgi:hypothetical protein
MLPSGCACRVEVDNSCYSRRACVSDMQLEEVEANTAVEVKEREAAAVMLDKELQVRRTRAITACAHYRCHSNAVHGIITCHLPETKAQVVEERLKLGLEVETTARLEQQQAIEKVRDVRQTACGDARDAEKCSCSRTAPARWAAAGGRQYQHTADEGGRCGPCAHGGDAAATGGDTKLSLPPSASPSHSPSSSPTAAPSIIPSQAPSVSPS